jgi:hypothetical protein
LTQPNNDTLATLALARYRAKFDKPRPESGSTSGEKSSLRQRAAFKQDASINSSEQIISHKVQEELERRASFDRETIMIHQKTKELDNRMDSIIEQWHSAGGAVGETPISHSLDRKYRPNEMTQEAYDISMDELGSRLSSLDAWRRRIIIEQRRRDEFDQKTRWI